MTISLHVYCLSGSERIFEIGQHLPKLWATVGCPFLLTLEVEGVGQRHRPRKTWNEVVHKEMND